MTIISLLAPHQQVNKWFNSFNCNNEIFKSPVYFVQPLKFFNEVTREAFEYCQQIQLRGSQAPAHSLNYYSIFFCAEISSSSTSLVSNITLLVWFCLLFTSYSWSFVTRGLHFKVSQPLWCNFFHKNITEPEQIGTESQLKFSIPKCVVQRHPK